MFFFLLPGCILLFLGCGCCGIVAALTNGGPGGMDTNTPIHKNNQIK